MPPLIVISGHPASGKTTVAERLANDLGTWPVISRDSIKESLFDRLGWQDRAWSQKLGQASWELWSWAIELLMKTHHPLIAESNFSGTQAGIHLRHLADHYAYACLEIHCVAPARCPDPALCRSRHVGSPSPRASGSSKPRRICRTVPKARNAVGNMLRPDLATDGKFKSSRLQRPRSSMPDNRALRSLRHCVSRTYPAGLLWRKINAARLWVSGTESPPGLIPCMATAGMAF